jgi:hypothetical protein
LPSSFRTDCCTPRLAMLARRSAPPRRSCPAPRAPASKAAHGLPFSALARFPPQPDQRMHPSRAGSILPLRHRTRSRHPRTPHRDPPRGHRRCTTTAPPRSPTRVPLSTTGGGRHEAPRPLSRPLCPGVAHPHAQQRCDRPPPWTTASAGGTWTCC